LSGYTFPNEERKTMSIRIIGSCGSGKSTAAREISRRFGIPWYELDNMVWDRSTPVNTRYPKEIRDAALYEAMSQAAWVIEGVDSGWSADSFREAELIMILHPHVLVRDYRIVRRFVRSRTGLEPWNYKQSFRNLWKMIVEWNHGYDMDKVLERTEAYREKRHLVKHSGEMIQLLLQSERAG
jgi:adenylate kinase family enzyme